MATITVSPVTTPLPRDELAKFLPNPRSVRAFEGIQTDVVQTIPDAIRQIVDLTNALLAAPYITWAETPTLEDERPLTVTSTLTLNNTGAQIILGLRETGFAAGFYGSEKQTIGVRVDLYGRVTGVEVYDLDSDNVTEGTANLFFTDERARDALSQGSGISYNNSTGQIAIDSSVVATLENGSFVPTVIGSSGGQATTSTAAGLYTKVGPMVTVQARVILSNAAGPTGRVQIGGLPYAPASGAGRWAANVRVCDGLTGYDLGGVIGSYVAAPGIIALADQTGTPIATTALTNGTGLDITATYIAA